MKVAVVTPTIGSEHLIRCVDSVDKQTYSDLTHYVFIDGEQSELSVIDKIEGATKVRKVVLEENVGKGWYGHRVYAACSFLVNADVICYLDEDNWYEPNHVEKLVNKIKQGNDWAYSLRKIYDKDGNFLCNDDCESLGKWPVSFNDEVFHIDTSSFAVRRDIAVRIGHAWYGQWGADRQFFGALKNHFPKFDCSNDYTMCYRLDGNPNSVTHEFFEKGNAVSTEKYPTNFPWKQGLIKEQLGPNISLIFN
jgi:glycosyltransferase involved in cell wall biosynthesis